MLVLLFSQRRYAELESQARLLVEHYPNSGFGWKVLCTSLQVQGKNALSALQKAAELLPIVGRGGLRAQGGSGLPADVREMGEGVNRK